VSEGSINIGYKIQSENKELIQASLPLKLPAELRKSVFSLEVLHPLSNNQVHECNATENNFASHVHHIF
jgi:hypothetical protein